MMNTIFLGGLKEDIRNSDPEEAPTKPEVSVKAAWGIKSILNNKKSQRGFHVTSIEGPQGEEDLDVGEVNQDKAAHLQMVNAMLQKRS